MASLYSGNHTCNDDTLRHCKQLQFLDRMDIELVDLVGRMVYKVIFPPFSNVLFLHQPIHHYHKQKFILNPPFKPKANFNHYV